MAKRKRCRTRGFEASSSSSSSSTNPPQLPPSLKPRTMRELLNARHTSLFRALEHDFRQVFKSEAGEFFVSKLVDLGWTPLFGGDDWWVSPSLVDRFKKNMQLLPDKSIQVKVKVRNRTRPVILTREMISAVTGIALNTNFDKTETNAPREITIASVINKIAPYRLPGHYSEATLDNPRGGFVQCKGLQVNVLAVAKWVTINVLGNQTLHKIRSEAAWFVSRLMDDTIPKGFCLCDFLLTTLRNYNKKGSLPLPFLTSRLMAHLLEISKPSDAIFYSPDAKTTNIKTLLRTQIPGVWDGVLKEGNDRPVPIVGGVAETEMDDIHEEEQLLLEWNVQGSPRVQVRVGDLTASDYRKLDMLDHVHPDDHIKALWNNMAITNAYFHDMYEQRHWTHPVVPGYNAPTGN